MLTDETLQEIAARRNATTPGQWKRDGDDIRTGTDSIVPHVQVAHVTDFLYHQSANAEFLAHAKEDVDLLLRAYVDLKRKAAPSIAAMEDYDYVWCESCSSWVEHEDYLAPSDPSSEGWCLNCYKTAPFECSNPKCDFRTNGADDFDGECPECGSRFQERTLLRYQRHAGVARSAICPSPRGSVDE